MYLHRKGGPLDFHTPVCHEGHEHIRRLSFFLWFHHGNSAFIDTQDDTKGVYAHTLITIGYTMFGYAAEDPEPTAFALSDIVHEYGALPVLTRLAVTLRRDTVTGSDLLRLYRLIQVLLLRPEFLPHFASSGVLLGLKEALDRSKPESDVAYNVAMVTLLDIYR